MADTSSEQQLEVVQTNTGILYRKSNVVIYLFCHRPVKVRKVHKHFKKTKLSFRPRYVNNIHAERTVLIEPIY